MLKKQTGITLVALVITIIILLILAGVTISTLTESGLFDRAKEAKQESENAQEKENAILKDYESTLNEYLSGTGGSSSEGDEEETPELGPEPLADKVKVGDYVKYEVDTASTAELITELGTYSGSTSNTTSTLVQEKDLNWRVLDIIEENGEKKVRLISETPTNTSTVALNGYNGYNNAVYLLDKICNTLYNKTGYTDKVQNLKIEDIEKYMVTKPTYSNTTVSPTALYYPSILAQEVNQTVNGTTGTLGISEQSVPINQTVAQQATSWSLKTTYWAQTMTAENFTNSKYYNLFINDGDNNYETYWISSRCIHDDSYGAAFDIRFVFDGSVTTNILYRSNDEPVEFAYFIRPVVTLNANVLADMTKSGDGSEVAKAFVLK